MQVHNNKRLATLTLAALGVVYGDIGTSPLYSIKEVFGGAHHPVPITPDNVLGILSLFLWSLIIVVTLKYVAFIMRANNKGEGGIIALMTLALHKGDPASKRHKVLIALGLFGAEHYAYIGIALSVVREFSPMIMGILIAGRSGSAYAAEIGTMVVNEEVDALQTMGFDPVRFLVVPKVLATVIVVPILTIYADLFGIIGGMIIGITSLDLTFNTYVTQSIKAISAFDVVTSLIKAAVFAGLVSAVGCQRGFMVRAGAQDVGKFTTSAVVSAIFMIVVADSIFAIMLYYVRRYETFT